MSSAWEDFTGDAGSAVAEAGGLAEGGPRTAKEFLTIKTEHFSFETLFIPARRRAAGPKKLAIALSHGGRTPVKTRDAVKTVFAMWSWHDVLPEYDLLCVEDPMYKLHPRLESGWFYGDKDASALTELREAVDGLRRAQGADESGVLFLGSSAGGYAALFLCDLMKGSSCVAMNPQLKLTNWWSFFLLKNALGLDPAVPDPLGRNDLARIAGNRESRFLITCSPKFKNDFDLQVKPLFDALSGSPCGDVSELPPAVIRDNFVFMFAKGGYPLPHLLVMDRLSVAVLAGYLRERRADTEDYAAVMKNCERRWHDEQELGCRLYWLTTLRQAVLTNCRFPVPGWKNCVIDSADGAFSVRIEVQAAQVGRKLPFNFYVTGKGTAEPGEAEAFIKTRPAIAESCKVTARPGEIKVEAPRTADMVKCLNELLELFARPRV